MEQIYIVEEYGPWITVLEIDRQTEKTVYWTQATAWGGPRQRRMRKTHRMFNSFAEAWAYARQVRFDKIERLEAQIEALRSEIFMLESYGEDDCKPWRY